MHKLIIILTALTALTTAGPGLDLISLSAGPWVTLANSRDINPKDSYFTSAALSVYFHTWGWKGMVSVPLTWTVEKYSAYSQWAAYPADLKFYTARRVYNVVPRLGLAIPTGYPTQANSAWIGSGGYKIIYGLGFNLGEYFNKSLAVNGEAQGDYNISGIEHGSRFGKGSNSGYLSLKSTWRLTRKLKTGVELFPFYSHITESDWAPGISQTSIGFVPMAFIQAGITSRIEVSAKGGYGFDGAGDKRLQVINGSLSVNYYMW